MVNRGNPITKVILNEILDNVENSLETFVIDNRRAGKHWVTMESMIQVQYEQRLENLLSGKGGSIHFLESSQKFIASNRIRDFMELSKQKYESD